MEQHQQTVTLTVQAEGQITHADGTTEPVKVTDSHTFGLKSEADGEVKHAQTQIEGESHG